MKPYFKDAASAISYACPGSSYIPLMFDTCPELVISTLMPCTVVTTSVAMVFTIFNLSFQA